MLYSEGDTATVNRCQGHWIRSKEELVEMINLPQLGDVHWKEEGKKVLAKMENTHRAERSCVSSVASGVLSLFTSCVKRER